MDRVDTWVYKSPFHSTVSTNEHIRCRFHSTELTHWYISVNQGRQVTQKMITVEIVEKWENPGRSQLTESTHEPNRVDHIRQNQHLSQSGSITVDRVDPWAITVHISQQSRNLSHRGRSQSTKSKNELGRVDHSRQSRHKLQSLSITVDRVDTWED